VDLSVHERNKHIYLVFLIAPEFVPSAKTAAYANQDNRQQIQRRAKEMQKVIGKPHRNTKLASIQPVGSPNLLAYSCNEVEIYESRYRRQLP
jgi:hypothetical protein